MSSTIAKESAEKLIYEGNLAFENKDMFTGIEKYRKGIEKYKEINDVNRLLDLLRKVSRVCIANNHLVLAREFAEELYKLAEINNQTFYQGIANYRIQSQGFGPNEPIADNNTREGRAKNRRIEFFRVK